MRCGARADVGVQVDVRTIAEADASTEPLTSPPQDASLDVRERPLERGARGLAVPAAAEAARQLRHVHVAHRAEAHLDVPVRQVAEQQRESHAGDGARVFDDAVEIVGGGAVAPQRVRWDRHPREPVLGLHHQGLEHFRHEAHTPLGGARVHRRIDRLGIHAVLEQRPRHPQRARRGIGEPEGPGVSEQTHVQRPRGLGRERPLERIREVEHQLGRGGGVGRDQARPPRERAAAHVVVDTCHRAGLRDDAREITQTAQVRDVEHHHDVGGLDFARGALGVIRAAGHEKMEPLRNGCGIRDRGADAACVKQMPQRDLAPHAVPVGVHMRGEGDAPAGSEHGRYRLRRPYALRRNRDSVCGHGIKISKGVERRRRTEASREDVQRRRHCRATVTSPR